MTDEVESLKRIANHEGVFGNYQMFGEEYENASGERAWHITVWPSDHGPVRHYWVQDEEFFSISIEVGFKHTHNTLIKNTGPATNIKPEEKQAILEAIAKWEAADRTSTK
jgi:hypothetical protein